MAPRDYPVQGLPGARQRQVLYGEVISTSPEPSPDSGIAPPLDPVAVDNTPEYGSGLLNPASTVPERLPVEGVSVSLIPDVPAYQQVDFPRSQ